MGVDVFFVISGYLITSIIVTERQTENFTLSNFYERRARRILPPLILVTTVCLPFAWFWMLPNDLKDFSQSLAGVSVFVSNIVFWKQSDYFATAAELKPLLHTWSLAVEEQFYIFFPLLILASWRFGKHRMMGLLAGAFVLSFAVCEYGTSVRPAATFFLLPTRAWELLMGAMAALFQFNTANTTPRSGFIADLASTCGIALIGYAIFFFDKNTVYPGVYALAPTVGTLLILLFATPKTSVGKILASKYLVGIGLISYSAYLWHQPILAFAKLRSPTELSSWAVVALALSPLGPAYFSWRYVERPFRDKEKVSSKSIFFSATLASALLLSLGVTGSFFNGIPDRLPPKAVEMLSYLPTAHSAAAYKRLDGTDCYGSPCSLGRLQEIADVAFVGDSHTAMLAQQLDRAFLDLGRSAIVRADVAAYLDSYPTWYPGQKHLSQILERTKRLISEKNIRVVVLTGRYTLKINRTPFNNGEGGVEKREDFLGLPEKKQDEIEDSIVKGIEDLLGAGKRVIFVEPIPEVGILVPKALATKYWENGSVNPSDLSTSYKIYEKRNERVLRIVRRFQTHPLFASVNASKLFCNTALLDRCITHLNNVPLYSDADHLSIPGTRMLVDEIVKKLH